MGVADRVVLTGERPYAPERGDDTPCVPDLMFAMDVLAGPSMTETDHMAAAEALAAGLPVLYTTAPAISDLPQEAAPRAWRVTGDAEEFTKELLRLYEVGPGERSVPDVVRINSIQNIARQTTDLYAAVLAET